MGNGRAFALIGTGLLTVALGLLAYDLAGPRAGAVLGTAYAIKMIAYVGLAPVVGGHGAAAGAAAGEPCQVQAPLAGQRPRLPRGFYPAIRAGPG